MPTLTKDIVVDGSPHIIQDDVIMPGFKSGIRIASFRILTAEYANNDTVVINVYGAKKILFAVVKSPAGTACIALTEAVLSGTLGGISLTTAAIAATVDLYVYIVYNTEVVT